MLWIAFAVVALITGAILGSLVFGIFRKSRVAVVLTLVSVVGLQLYTWFVQHLSAGTLLSVIVTGFLLRGAKRIFEDHQEADADNGSSVPKI